MFLWVIGILLIVSAIALIVFLLRKYVPGLKGEEVKQNEDDIVKENIARLVVDPKEEDSEEDDTEEK